MSLRWFVFLFAVGALVLLAECVPVEHTQGEVEGVQLSPDSLDQGSHVLEKRSDKATTLEDALNIPIAALEAVRRLLTNRFGGSSHDQEQKNA